jgi:hypothetical protein
MAKDIMDDGHGNKYKFDKVVVTGINVDDATNKLNDYVVKNIQSSAFLYTVKKINGKWSGCRYTNM